MRMQDYLLVEDKWDTYAVNNERGVEWAALDLLKQRVEQDFWYWDEDAARAKKIVEDEDADAALKFLLGRAEHEYEYVEVK